MSFEREFYDLMPATVTVAQLASRTVTGTPTYSTAASTYRARIVQQQHQIRDMQGNTIEAAAILWIASTGTINATDRILMPAGSGSTAPPILAVESFPDEDGTHHYKLHLGY